MKVEEAVKRCLGQQSSHDRVVDYLDLSSKVAGPAEAQTPHYHYSLGGVRAEDQAAARNRHFEMSCSARTVEALEEVRSSRCWTWCNLPCADTTGVVLVVGRSRHRAAVLPC